MSRESTKSFRISDEELQSVYQTMKILGYTCFSDFVRDQILFLPGSKTNKAMIKKIEILIHQFNRQKWLIEKCLSPDRALSSEEIELLMNSNNQLLATMAELRASVHRSN